MAKRSGLLRALTFIFSLLLAFSLGFNSIASMYGDVINDVLQLNTTKVDNAGTVNELYISKYTGMKQLLDDKYALIQQICAEGAVLLKNDGTLPLASETKISLFGRNSTNFVYGTSNGAGQVNTDLCADLKTVFTSFGFEVNPTLWDFYANSDTKPRTVGESSYTIGELPASEYTGAVRSSYAQYNDAAIVVYSRVNGEGTDFLMDAGTVSDGDGRNVVLGLQDNERAALAEAKSCSDKVIVLLNSDYPMEIDELKNDPEVDAILWVGATGVDGVYGTVQVIRGELSPSGHLTDTFAVSSQSAPAMQNFGDFTFANEAAISATTANKYVVYQEGIYVGYKYYETRYEDTVYGQGSADAGGWNYGDEVSYSFGYGLSYTTFQETIKEWSIDVPSKTATMVVNVKNTGDVAGKHVVELFAQSPYTEYDIANGVEKAAVQLLDFEKTDVLEPGADVDVTLNIDLYLLASYDAKGAKTYIWDDGEYYFALGNGAHDALNNILAAKGKTTADGMDYDGSPDLVKSYTQDSFDAVTFSTSVNGTAITNHLDDMDLNYYGMDLTYLSRNDWAGTFPTPQTGLVASDALIEALGDGASYTPTDAAKDFSNVVEGTNYGSTSTQLELIDMVGVDYDDPQWDSLLNQLTIKELAHSVSDARVGAYACSSINFAGCSQTDGPQGIRNTYKADESQYAISPAMYQSECVLACTFSKELAWAQGEMFGEDGLWSDVSGAWAPGSNTHRTPYCGRNCEYFSEDGVLAGMMGRAECLGANEYGVVMQPKHFCFNDQETNRGGLATFANEQEGREIILRAFELPFSSGANVGSMLATNRVGAYYSGANYNLLQHIVREEWGMHGSFITDMTGGSEYVHGPASAIAGTTMINSNNASYYAGANGTLSETVVLSDATLFAAVREDVHRNLWQWANSNAMNGVVSGATFSYVTPWWQVLHIALMAVFAVGTAAFGALDVVSVLKQKKEDGNA